MDPASKFVAEAAAAASYVTAMTLERMLQDLLTITGDDVDLDLEFEVEIDMNVEYTNVTFRDQAPGGQVPGAEGADASVPNETPTSESEDESSDESDGYESSPDAEPKEPKYEEVLQPDGSKIRYGKDYVCIVLPNEPNPSSSPQPDKKED